MKKLLGILTAMFLMANMVSAVSTGIGVGIGVTPNNIEPQVFIDVSSRQLFDTFDELLERQNYYAFEGEKIMWNILVRDGNGIEDIASVNVVFSVDSPIGGMPMNNTNALCTIAQVQPSDGDNVSSYDADVFDIITDRVYSCETVILDAENTFGYAQVRATVEDNRGATNPILANESNKAEFVFVNPSIGLEISDADNGLSFGDLEPGETGYSQDIYLTIDVPSQSGVILDVDMKGTDFSDSSGNPAMCPTSNVLELSNFRYFAEKAGSSAQPPLPTTANSPTADLEGYDIIGVDWSDVIAGSGDEASHLTYEDYLKITFKLDLPNPCFGDFTEGSFNFQGEAI